MSLRRRALIYSLLPLLCLVAFVLPEAFLHFEAIGAIRANARIAERAELARDISDTRVQTSLAVRRMLNGERQPADAYERAQAAFDAAAQRFARLERTAPAEVAGARAIEAGVADMDRLFARVVRDFRAGRTGRARDEHASPRYDRSVDRVEHAIRLFRLQADRAQTRQRATMEILWRGSLVLVLAPVLALFVAMLLTIGRTSAFAGALDTLVRKVERYRNGEPLGERSQRGDEIGLLDGALHDLVAEQRERERELRVYRLLADVTSDVILFVDRSELTVVEANASALAAYGYLRSELIGMPLQVLSPDPRLGDPDWLAAADRPTGLCVEAVHRRADGSTFPVELCARTARIDGRLLIAATIRDISERRRAAEEVSKALAEAVIASRLKSEFVATTSHEIRTPLQVVIGASELLLASDLDAKQRECAHLMSDSAQSLLGTVDDLLDFSKLESGKVALEPVAFDPRATVDEALDTVRAPAANKGLLLRADLAPDVPAELHGDPARLRQVLVNLVGNAVKFTARGTVAVSAGLLRADSASVTLHFAVSDTGIGVAPHARAQLFEPFVQADASTTRPFGGLGLGLSISRQLVELMGGTIWLRDDVGPGATFCFTARFERPAAVAGADRDGRPSAARAASDETVRTAPRILLVEDNALVRRVVGFQIEELGFGFDAVGDGEAAVAAVGHTRYDLVLMDMRMPRMDGLEATRRIRAGERGSGHRATIVALTANVLEEDRAACREAGMDDVLTKPLRVDALRAVLAHRVGASI